MRNITLSITLSLTLLLITKTTATDFGNRQVTQYEPYLEWQINNVNYSGNKFDVVATVTFTHSSGASHTTEMFWDDNSTWKWRFSGSETGNWSFTTSSDNNSLNGHTGTVTVTPNNDSKVKGYIRASGPQELRKWTWSKDNRAFVPNYDMYTIPSEFYNNNNEINNAIDRVIDEHGFTGFHLASISGWWFDINRSNNDVKSGDNNPDPRTMEALEQLITKTYKAGGCVHFWLWGDDSRKENMDFSSTGVMGTAERRLHRYLAARLGPIPGWSVGYGYDLGEWMGSEKLNEWEEYIQSKLGWFHYTGGRYQGPKKNPDHSPGRVWNERMEYAAWEHHRPTKQALINATTEVTGKPLFSEDRFRIRPNTGAFRDKDFSNDGADTRQYFYRLAASGGFASIWGYIEGDQDFGSDEYPNKQELRKYTKFFYEDEWRFHSDYVIANDLSTNDDAYVLKTTDNKHYLIYIEDTSSVNINLSQANGNPTGVAMNTVGNNYQEITLNNLNNSNQNISLNSNSDWIIYISTDGSGATQPVTCDTPKNLTTTNITQNGATLNWETIVNNAEYELRYKAGDSPWQQNVLSTKSITLTGLQPNKSYTWQVKTSCDSNDSEYSEEKSFTTLEQQEQDLVVIYDDEEQNGYDIKSWGTVSVEKGYVGDAYSGSKSIIGVLSDCDFLVIKKQTGEENISNAKALKFYAKTLEQGVTLKIALRGNVATSFQSVELNSSWNEVNIDMDEFSPELNTLKKYYSK